MEIKAVSIKVDSRETRAGTAEKLRRIPGVEVIVEEMETGDYAILDTALGIERKAANDFATSIMSGHLFGQIELIKSKFDRAIVLIEGDLGSIQSQISPEALDGAISYIALLSGVQLMYTANVDHTVRLLHRLSLHLTHGLGYRDSTRRRDRVCQSSKPVDLWREPFERDESEGADQIRSEK